MKTCVQIGLHKTAEYLYLYDRSLEIPERCDVPSSFLEADYRYIGVDSDPFSIARMSDTYADSDRHQWVCAKIGKQWGIESTQACWGEPRHLLPDPNKLREVLVGTYSLYDFFLLLKIQDIDLLAMDIEGAEVDCFKTYNWSIKPSLLRVEFHPSHKMDVDGFINLICDHGYQHTLIYAHGNERFELQFQHQDAI